MRLRGGSPALNDGDIELLDIAFKYSAEAGSPNVGYIRGVFSNWKSAEVYTSEEYWEHEVQRDRAFMASLKA